jgi:pimeloyl-ACP methyl ester carboxylesterase
MKPIRVLCAISVIIIIFTGCASQYKSVESLNETQASSGWVRKELLNTSVIVFVHGVVGNSKDTWLNEETGSYWPKLILNDPDFHETNIYTYEYGTPSIGNALSVSQLATEMKIRLLSDGVLNHPHTYFIVHSMGGLVTRQFILRYREEVAEKIQTLYFIGTPTTGSPAATLAALFSFNPQFQNMKPAILDGYLANVSLDWQASGQLRSIPSYCAYETQPIGSTLVVPFESATNLCNKALLPIPADHMKISKPRDNKALQYIAFKNIFIADGGTTKILPEPEAALTPEQETNIRNFVMPNCDNAKNVKKLYAIAQKLVSQEAREIEYSSLISDAICVGNEKLANELFSKLTTQSRRDDSARVVAEIYVTNSKYDEAQKWINYLSDEKDREWWLQRLIELIKINNI